MSESAFLYRITNSINGMQYIGVTKNPKVRFRGHAFHNTKTRSILKSAMKKYGAENFNMEILLESTQEYCYSMEATFIKHCNTRKPYGYNICAGGRGAVGLVGEDNGMFGKKGKLHHNFGKVGYRTGIAHTEEAKAKMSVAGKGRKKSVETCAKLKEISLNRSPELLEKMRIARIAAIQRKKEQSCPNE